MVKNLLTGQLSLKGKFKETAHMSGNSQPHASPFPDDMVPFSGFN